MEAGDPPGLRQHRGITNHDPVSERPQVRVGQGLEDDFRADAGGIAHGEGNGGKVVYGLRHAKKSATWMRASGSPKPPALVATGS